VLTYQSDFDWVDLRFYDVREAWGTRDLLAGPGGNTLLQHTRTRLVRAFGHERGCYPIVPMCAGAAWAMRERCLSPISAVSLLSRAS
jgi:hypothetical protein